MFVWAFKKGAQNQRDNSTMREKQPTHILVLFKQRIQAKVWTNGRERSVRPPKPALSTQKHFMVGQTNLNAKGKKKSLGGAGEEKADERKRTKERIGLPTSFHGNSFAIAFTNGRRARNTNGAKRRLVQNGGMKFELQL